MFFTATLVAAGIFYITYLSVSLGFTGEYSGNYYRLYAWGNALDEIGMNPFWGIDTGIPALPADFSVSEDNLLYYKVYESTLLQDAVLYGIPFVLFKLAFFYELGRQVFKQNESTSVLVRDVKRFLVFFLVVDFSVFSFFQMPVLTVVISAILFSNTLQRPSIGKRRAESFDTTNRKVEYGLG